MNKDLNKYNINIYRAACENLKEAVNNQLFEGGRTPYWIGDEVGGLCDFEEYMILSTTDMVLIIENNLTYEQVSEWINAGVDYNRERESEKYINLDEWIKGERYEMLDN